MFQLIKYLRVIEHNLRMREWLHVSLNNCTVMCTYEKLIAIYVLYTDIYRKSYCIRLLDLYTCILLYIHTSMGHSRRKCKMNLRTRDLRPYFDEFLNIQTFIF